MEALIPVLDVKVLQEKTTEAAMAGAVKAINEYYTGYNSPFMKKIQGDLQGKVIGNFELPDVLALINDGISKQIDAIANNAVAQSFVPMVTRLLTRMKNDVTTRDILEEFVKYKKDANSNFDISDYECEIKRQESYSWHNMKIFQDGNELYSITLHDPWDSEKKEGITSCKIFNLPYVMHGEMKQTMKLSVNDGVMLEMPFTTDVISNKFMSYIARIIISGVRVKITSTDFDEDMAGVEHDY